MAAKLIVSGAMINRRGAGHSNREAFFPILS
jgi:hypothetical protein